MNNVNRPLENWKTDDDITADRLNMMQVLAQAAQLSAQSPNVHLFRTEFGGTSISVDPSNDVAPSPLARIYIPYDATYHGGLMGGCYYGIVSTLPTSPLPTTGTMLQEHLTGEGGTPCYAYNPMEIGDTTHNLVAAGNSVGDGKDQRTFIGYRIGTSQDGTDVYQLTGLWARSCATPAL